MIFGTSQRLAPPAIALNPDQVYFRIGSVALTGEELLTTGVTVVVVVALGLMFRSSGLGLRMRAVVESPRMTELAGIRADQVGTLAWMLSSLLAGLAGVLLAPIYAILDPSYFTALLVAAIAAAAVGGFASLPLTLVGGIGLGVVQEVIGGYLPSGTVLSSGLRPAFPFVVLAVLLVARRSFRPAGPLGDPLSACDPPPASLKPPVRMTEVALGSRAFIALLVAVFIVFTLVLVPGNWEFALTQGLVFSIILLSITLLTGMSGQISLCQASFAAVGAFTAGQLATHFGTALLVGILAGGALAGLVGLVVAIPSLRLGGIALALLTLSFALLGDNVLFQYSWSGNGATGLSIPRPTIGNLSFAGSGAYFWLALVVLALAAGIVWLLQHGSVGGELGALRASEVGAESVGINVRRLRVIAFMLSAALAGVGGALYASLEQTVSPADFNYEFSLIFVIVVATVGVYSVAGAIEAGLAYTVLQQLINTLPGRFGSLVALIFGLAAVTYVRHPEGAVEFLRRLVLDRAEQFAHFLTRNDQPAAELTVGSGPGGR